jgi:hypothetical protein
MVELNGFRLRRLCLKDVILDVFTMYDEFWLRRFCSKNNLNSMIGSLQTKKNDVRASFKKINIFSYLFLFLLV